MSYSKPADESVGEHDEIEPRFEWNWKKKHRRCGEVGVSVSETSVYREKNIPMIALQI